MLGIGVAFDNLLSVVACIVLPLVGALRRIEVEEDTLSRELGDSYKTYAQRTSRLIPGVW
jgi:protein-S-isoprenylcysteine O-methyltransferase Ste14